MGYAIFADRELFYQHMVNDLNFQLECIARKKLFLMQKTADYENTEDMIRTRAGNVLAEGTAKGAYEMALRSAGSSLSEADLTAKIGEFKPAEGMQARDAYKSGLEAAGKTPEEVNALLAQYDAAAPQRERYLASWEATKNLLPQESERIAAAYKAQHGQEIDQNTLSVLTGSKQQELMIRFTERAIKQLAVEDDYLDLCQKRIETKLAAAQQQLQAVQQAKGQAIQQATPKYVA